MGGPAIAVVVPVGSARALHAAAAAYLAGESGFSHRPGMRGGCLSEAAYDLSFCYRPPTTGKVLGNRVEKRTPSSLLARGQLALHS
jgi:hypothetical protein